MARKSVNRYDATRYNFFDNSEYRRSHGYNDGVVTYEIDGEKKILPKSVVKLLELIFNKTSIDKFLKDNSIQPNYFEQATNVFLGVLLGTNIALHILNDLFLMRDARTIMQECENDPNAVYLYYMKLKTKIRPLEKNIDEYQKIAEYVKNSHGPTHTDYNLEVMEIFKISRRGEFRKYKEFRNKKRKLLWHGSRLANFASIMLKGLQISPNAEKTGSMFGEGIYFADIVTKSANYCGTDRNNPIGVALLAEVAIGETYKLTKAEYVTSLPAGKDSVKAFGKMQPDFRYHKYTKNHVQVPFGKPYKVKDNMKLQYNEYIVYNPDQILCQYLVQLKFNYK